MRKATRFLLGNEDFTPCALRHAAASGWIASKIGLKRLQVWIGHESIQLSLDTYGHLLADQERDAKLAILVSSDLFGLVRIVLILAP